MKCSSPLGDSTLRRRRPSGIHFDKDRLSMAHAATTPAMFRPESIGIGMGIDTAGKADAGCYAPLGV